MKEVITIGIAEDHGLLRQGLVSLLKAHKVINVLFDVANGKELLDKLKVARPHILLLDLEMPIMRGQEVLEVIKKKYPKIKVIVISAYFQKEYIVECFKLGICAFLPKDHKIEKVVEAIVSVYENGIYSDVEVTKILAAEVLNSNPKKPESKAILSNTELEVLNLICKGTSRRKASEILSVKIETVNFHMSNIMRKTGIHNAPALVKYAIENKLVKS